MRQRWVPTVASDPRSRPAWRRDRADRAGARAVRRVGGPRVRWRCRGFGSPARLRRAARRPVARPRHRRGPPLAASPRRDRARRTGAAARRPAAARHSARVRSAAARWSWPPRNRRQLVTGALRRCSRRHPFVRTAALLHARFYALMPWEPRPAAPCADPPVPAPRLVASRRAAATSAGRRGRHSPSPPALDRLGAAGLAGGNRCSPTPSNPRRRLAGARPRRLGSVALRALDVAGLGPTGAR